MSKNNEIPLSELLKEVKNEKLINIFSDDNDSYNDNKTKKNKTINENTELIQNIKMYGIKCREPLTSYIFVSSKNYNFKGWCECFPDDKVELLTLIYNFSWKNFFLSITKKKYFKEIEKKLSILVSKKKQIFPLPELTFNIFNILSINKIKVIIIGQDPYPGSEIIKNKIIPQATGISFSAPLSYPKPASLKNIYNNLLKFGHIKDIPNDGSLSFWAIQGCFMINSSLTTISGKINVHKNIWSFFTQDLLEYLNNTLSNVVFVAWGKEAHNLCRNIDDKKHLIITSSHPSPLSFSKKMNGFVYGTNDKKEYPSFSEVDHFGKINNYLSKNNKTQILWNIW